MKHCYIERLTLILLAASLAAGCTRTLEEPAPSEASPAVFTGILEQAQATRTTLGALQDGILPVMWSMDDEVKIGTVLHRVASVSDDGLTATFAPVDGSQQLKKEVSYYTTTSESKYLACSSGGNLYLACYPPTLFDDWFTTRFQAVQYYKEGRIDNLPMYALSTSDETFVFRNLCAVLAVSLVGSADTKVDKIEVESTSKKLSGISMANRDNPKTQGGFVHSATNPAFYIYTGSGYSNKLTLNCTTNTGGLGVALDPATPRTFYIGIPPGVEYAAGSLSVKAYKTGETTPFQTFTSKVALTPKRNHIYQVKDKSLFTEGEEILWEQESFGENVLWDNKYVFEGDFATALDYSAMGGDHTLATGFLSCMDDNGAFYPLPFVFQYSATGADGTWTQGLPDWIAVSGAIDSIIGATEPSAINLYVYPLNENNSRSVYVRVLQLATGRTSAPCKITQSSGRTTPLTIEPRDAGTTKITIPNPNGLTYKWSIDGGAKQSSSDDPVVINATQGQKVALYQDGAVALGLDIYTLTGITFDKPSYVYGNVMSLASETNFATLDTCVDSQFQYLFSWNKKLLSHPTEPLVLPATTLAASCYDSMFECCTAMERAPILPATTLAANCYTAMFASCSSLAQAPALPATTLAAFCYNAMFIDCTSLTSAPALPATTLAEGCYAAMFAECSSLTSAPALLATVMADKCYSGMFRLCESLTTAPFLPATQLAPRCYRNMFENCTSLVSVQAELPATTLADYCYQEMFKKCTSLTTAPVIRATTMAVWGCWSMFLDCKSLVSVQAELFATTMEDRCYESMFQRCTSLTTAPALPATTLAEECYSYMFQGCSSLTSAPALPATVAVTNCYMNMFQYCSNLNYVECNLLDRNDSNGYCCTDFWLDDTAATGTFKKNPAATWPYNHQTAPGDSEYDGVPAGWTIVDIP